jgi:hypothetical protein
MSFVRWLISTNVPGRGARGAGRANERRLPPIGATLCCNQFRISVQAGFNRDLWQWLMAQGWRVLPAGDDRYRYRPLPSNVVAALIDAAPEERERLLALGVRRAVETVRASAIGA